MQLALVIYNARITSYRKMKTIDAVIDSEPTEQRIKDLAEQRNLNLLAFKELENFNQYGLWLNKHPLLSEYSVTFQLREMLRKDPGEFLREYKKVSNYVDRYTSYLNNDKRADDQKKKDKKNLRKYREKERLMQEVLDESKREL